MDGNLVPVDGKLYYRGVDVDDLVKNYRADSCDGFEEATYLLLFDKLRPRTSLRTFAVSSPDTARCRRILCAT